MENHIDRREIRDAMNGGYGMSRRYSSTLTQKTIYCAKMLKDGSFLRISTESASVPALVLGMIQPMIFVAVIAVILSAVLAHRMAKRIVTPLNELNLDTPLENNETYPEISPLLTRIDVQHKKIERQIRELQRKNDELQQITESMNEALVMLDVNGCVLGINSAARQLFEVDNSCIGSDFLTVDRNPEFNRRIMNAFAGSNETFNLQKHGREYKVDISRVESGENLAGILLLAFDVTEQAETEKMRREFTANVSHELKTPLQSIMGSAELIENGLVKPEDMPHFIKNIRTESARLVALIEDIIRLSRLDEGVEIPKTEVDLLNVATETAELLRSNAEAKNVSVKVHGKSAVVFGVDRLIYEIAYNLCENAVKYNIPGGAAADADAEHSGTCCRSRRVICHVSPERLAAHRLCFCFTQQLGWVHQLVALHDVAVVISILAELLLGVDALEFVVGVSSFSSLYFICNLHVGYSEVELCCSIIHLDDNRSTSCDVSLYLFEFYGFCNIIS